MFKYLRCKLFGHVWEPVLHEVLREVYGSGGYYCARCPYGSRSKEAFMKFLNEII